MIPRRRLLIDRNDNVPVQKNNGHVLDALCSMLLQIKLARSVEQKMTRIPTTIHSAIYLKSLLPIHLLDYLHQSVPSL
jgi:hypothetical protein